MIAKSLKAPEPGFQFGGHTSVTFNGDIATLYVGRLDNHGEAATPRLQVWALPAAPVGDEVDGVLLAEAEAQTLNGGYYLEYITLDATVGDSVRGLQTIVVTVSRAGSLGWHDDAVVMPDLFDFYHPQLMQPASAKLTSSGFTASVAGVSNPRASGLVSGSLVVEFWALENAGGFSGNDFHLGGIEHLSTAGGDVTGPIEFGNNCHYPEGNFFPAIVLREWSGSSYLVRDRIVGSSTLQLPPQGDEIADAFNAAVPVAKPVEVKATQAVEALKSGPDRKESVATPKKVVAPVEAEPVKIPAKKTTAAKKAVEAKPGAKKVVKTVKTKKVVTKKAAKKATRTASKKAAKKTASKSPNKK